MNDFLWWHFFLWWCFVFDPLPPYPYDGLLSLVLWRVNLWCRSLTVAGWIPSVSQVLISEMHCWQKVLELWVWSSVHVQDWSTRMEWHAGVSGWRFLLRVSGAWEDVFARSIQNRLANTSTCVWRVYVSLYFSAPASSLHELLVLVHIHVRLLLLILVFLTLMVVLP